MKKFFLLCVVAFATAANAEIITLDLSTATDLNSMPIQYQTESIPVYMGNLQNVWDSTYAEGWESSFVMANEATFMFAHVANAIWSSWSGFTISKVAEDTLNQFACAAKGGVAGVGTPFMVSYGEDTKMYFKSDYYPTEVQICQSTYTLNSLRLGDGYAHKFTKNDTLMLTIAGFNNVDEETHSVVYYLAVDSLFNTDWTVVDLSPIGKCMGLNFHLSSTDCSTYDGVTYMNTPAYFALDALKVSDEELSTGIGGLSVSPTEVRKVVIDGQLWLMRNGVRYTLQGQRVE